MSHSSTSRDTTAFLQTITSAERFDQLEHFVGMPARIHVVEHVAHGALLVDDEGRAHDGVLVRAVYLAILEHTVLAAHFGLGVGKQPDGHTIVVAELRVAKAVVGADANHYAV